MMERDELEDRLSELQTTDTFRRVNREFDQLLEILGNVDGQECTALVMIAMQNVACDLTDF